MKIKKTLNKKCSSSNGSRAKGSMENLSLSISLAKGLLATLSTNDPSVWTKKCQTKRAREHTRILLQEVMDEIWNADLAFSKLISQLNKKNLTIT